MTRPSLSTALRTLAIATALAAGPLAAHAAAQSGSGVSGIFDTRYCEIITAERKMLEAKPTVYNTLRLNDCPDAAWKAIDAEAVAKELNVTRVNKNGPRYWTIDGIVGRGVSINGARATFGGIAMDQRATLEMKLLGGAIGRDPYKPTEVQRDTVFVFKAGNPVFELTAPDGHVYMMQSYAQIVDPGLSLADLAELGARLNLPKGWTFSTRTLDEEYRLEANGVAYVLQDDLQNSYQRRPK